MSKSVFSEARPFNVALVGLGAISKFYLAAIEKNSKLHLLAVCDLDPSKLKVFATRGLFTTTNLRELAEIKELDAVIITLPNAMHFTVCEFFLNAGRHVCCEKPLALSPDEAARLEAIAEIGRVSLFTAFHRRYNIHARSFAKRRRANRSIQYLRARYFENIREHCGADPWYLRPDQCGGGVVIDNGTNVFDLVQFLLGDFTLQSADIVRDSAGVDVKARVRASTESGTRIEILLDWDYQNGEQKDVYVEYSDGTRETIDLLEEFTEFKASLFHEYELLLAHFLSRATHSLDDPLTRETASGAKVAQWVDEVYKMARRVPAIKEVPDSSFAGQKSATPGTFVKIFSHVGKKRSMALIPERSRALLKEQIHEIVVTDETHHAVGDTIDRVGFVGFAVINESGVVEVGDAVFVQSRFLGKVIGFDSCHAPNHYNIVIEARQLQSGADLRLEVGNEIRFTPGGSGHSPNGELPQVLVAGFGYAGKTLHLPCLRKAREKIAGAPRALSPEILVFDPHCEVTSGNAFSDSLQRLESLSELERSHASRLVVHVCTPPSVRLSLVKELLELGVKKFIIEKPLASTEKEGAELARWMKIYHAEALVVANWSTSHLTAALVRRIQENRANGIGLKDVTISHNKSRIGRNLASSKTEKATDVEFPHMVVLAHILGGGKPEVDWATTWDCVVRETIVPRMGGVTAQLTLPGGIQAHLRSDLMAPFKEKSVRLEFSDGSKLDGFFPADGVDLTSMLFVYDATGARTESLYFNDDTLTQFFVDAYHFFLCGGPKPSSDLGFHLEINAVLRAIDECSRSHEVFSIRPVDTEIARAL